MERAQARSTRIKPGERPRRPRDLLLVVNRITAGLTILSIPKERFRIRRSTVTDSVSGFSFISPVHPAPYRSIDPPRPQRIIFPRENAHPAFLPKPKLAPHSSLVSLPPDISAREIRETRRKWRNRSIWSSIFSRENNSFAFVATVKFLREGNARRGEVRWLTLRARYFVRQLEWETILFMLDLSPIYKRAVSWIGFVNRFIIFFFKMGNVVDLYFKMDNQLNDYSWQRH